MKNEELIQLCLEANKNSHKRAREIAIKTNTFLIYEREGKIVKVDPKTMETVN
jgi:hypothetical protein